jgi:DNA (cytosine-5)-methyltransferase 1
MLTFGSLFAGIGGFDAGFEAAGLRCLWQVEIEADCRSVLARHFPDSERFDDVRAVGRQNLKPVDVICGGFPCQDLSVAGKRAGLAGERSGLFHEMVRITDELRPSFLIWENVPGLLSSDDGRDFARVLISLDAIRYSGAWTGLDAQWFGEAQRRRRLFGVFARGDIGAASSAEILSLSESLRRDTPTRGEAGQRIASTVKSSSPSQRNGGSYPTPDEFVITPTLRSNGDAHSGFTDEGGLVAHTLRAEGHDAGADGTGRGVPLVAATIKQRGRGACDEVMDNLVVSRDSVPKTADGLVTDLRAGNPHISAVMVAANNFGEREVSTSLSTSNERIDGDTETFVVAFTERGREGGANLECQENLAYTLRDPQKGMNSRNAILSTGVRRLTPRECERLQGFPDDWTAHGERNEPISDSARYRMLGNAVAVPCARWIGERLRRSALKG